MKKQRDRKRIRIDSYSERKIPTRKGTKAPTVARTMSEKQVSSRKQMRKDRSAFREATARHADLTGERGLKIGGFRETIRLFTDGDSSPWWQQPSCAN